MPKHMGAYIVAVRFAVLGTSTVNGAKLVKTSEIPLLPAAKIQHGDTLAVLGSGSAGATWSQYSLWTPFRVWANVQTLTLTHCHQADNRFDHSEHQNLKYCHCDL